MAGVRACGQEVGRCGFGDREFGVVDRGDWGAVGFIYCGVCEKGGRRCGGESECEDVVLGECVGDGGAVWRVSIFGLNALGGRGEWCEGPSANGLRGRFMTFAPEWLSGSPNLDTSNFMYT